MVFAIGWYCSGFLITSTFGLSIEAGTTGFGLRGGGMVKERATGLSVGFSSFWLFALTTK